MERGGKASVMLLVGMQPQLAALTVLPTRFACKGIQRGMSHVEWAMELE